MQIPFSLGDFLNVFNAYNQFIFPLQIVLYFIAFLCIYILFTENKNTNKIISVVLSFFWLWMGIVYHLIFFSAINKAAYIFGALFIIQGILLFIWGVIKGELSFYYRKTNYNHAGILILLYALIIYPVLGYNLGHAYPYSPTFGLPCPTTIFTFGLLLFINKKIPVYILIIPLLWSFIGFTAALTLSIYEDIGLLVAGLTATTLLIISNKNLVANDYRNK